MLRSTIYLEVHVFLSHSVALTIHLLHYLLCRILLILSLE